MKSDRETLVVQIDKEILEKIRQFAQEDDRTVSSVIRLAIKDFLNSKNIRG